MFKPGCIRKIEVFNFVTYSHVEVYPGPNLNMIIGPNGTGKSTIVAAIILGLGGNPKIVGRGKKVADYVKHGCSNTTISLYLQGKNGSELVNIMRKFDTQNKTEWRINGNICTLKDVIKYVQEYNIQIDNLCQFLPQDRVADFAKLNKKELLNETQLALCREDLIEKQIFLTSAKTRYVTLLKELNNQKQLLQENKNANCRLEGRVQNVYKRLKYEEKVSNISRKTAWMKYKEARDKLQGIKANKETAQKELLKVRSLVEPAEQDIAKHKDGLNKWQKESSNINKIVRSLELDMNTANDKLEAAFDKIGQVDEEITRKLAEISQVDKQIQETNTKLMEMEKTHASLLENVNKEKSQQQGITDEIAKRLAHIKKLNSKKDQMKQLRIEKWSKNKLLENEQFKIENVKQNRLEKLKRDSRDAYEAVNWLKDNRHLFEDEIFDPIILELNMLDKNKSKYVESMIPKRDRVAFTCVNKNDMNKLIKCLREEKKLSINVLHAGGQSQGYSVPDILTANLQKYGFYTFVAKLFTAPDPIMNYLCRTYNLHKIPIGDSVTNGLADNVPEQYSVFFSDTHMFVANYSTYTHEKSIRQNVIRGDGGFSLIVDLDRLQIIKDNYIDNKETINEIDTQLIALDTEIDKIESSLNRFREKLRAFKQQTDQLELFKTRTATVRQHLKDMKQNKLSPEQIHQEGKIKKKKLLQAIASIQETLIKYLEKIKKLVIKNNLALLSAEIARQNIDAIDSKIIDLKKDLDAATEVYTFISKQYTQVLQEAKKLLQEAKEISEGFTPADDGFDPFREIYDQLPDSITELDSIKDKIKAKIACLTTADDAEVHEYEARKQKIDQNIENINSMESEIAGISNNMDNAEQEWLTPLKDLLSRINTNFSRAFQKMGCAGEVSLSETDDKNYAEYGISIKVTYRNGEPLQELNATVQSGGERAVATAAFILALQELTPVPFRCVDEINQGMDVTNERRIFEFIVQTTCQATTSQYFLITPKLVPNLSYDEHIDVHIVHNGPFVNPNNRWNQSEMCNPRAVTTGSY